MRTGECKLGCNGLDVKDFDSILRNGVFFKLGSRKSGCEAAIDGERNPCGGNIGQRPLLRKT